MSNLVRRRFRRPLSALLLAACGLAASADGRIPFQLVARTPHDSAAFTQGLFFHGGTFYEGTGRYGHSEIRQVRIADGQVLQRRALDAERYGEGVARHGEHIIQLTWRAGMAYRYRLDDLVAEDGFTYDTEGWGITSDGRQLITSDGSATLYWRDPGRFAVTRTLEVRQGHRPVTGLNELEWVKGGILANVWPTDRIVRIDPDTGTVTGWIDLAPLRDEPGMGSSVDVANGIAHDAATDRLWVTGKYWPYVFEISLPPAP